MFDTIAILPEIVLTLAGIFVMLTSAFFERGGRRASTVVAHLGLLATVIAVGYQWNRGGAYFRGMFLIDSFGLFFHLLFLLIAALVMLSVSDYLDRENLPPAEFHALILFATVGMGIMVSSSDLILIFIGLEISSLASYILVGFRRDASPSSEAALKYFLLGSFATAFLLYGIALIFGATGSTRLPGINVALLGGHQTATLAAPAGSFPGQEVQTAQVILNAEFPVSL